MNKILNTAWDLWCIASVIGIWPRFIEPRIISTTHISLTIPNLSKEWNGTRLLHFSDLHFFPSTSPSFLKKISRKIQICRPDLILFTGDFLCYGKGDLLPSLREFLNTLSAPLGCYAIYGNHDYSEYVSLDEKGIPSLLLTDKAPIRRGFKKLLAPPLIPQYDQAAHLKQTPPLPELFDMLQTTPFKILENETLQLKKGNTSINLTGLGDLYLGRCDPQTAFQSYSKGNPGIILSHNPDSAAYLDDYPGNLILSGHTHGGQVNLPWMRRQFTPLKHDQWRRGLTTLKKNDRWLYTNRGLGSVFPFRWFSTPELTLITLRSPL